MTKKGSLIKPVEFLTKLNKLPQDARGSFSTAVLTLSKVASAEVIRVMLKDENFAVKINAIKAIRKHNLTVYETHLMKLLLDESFEVKIASIRTLASFGDARHYKLLQAFYMENEKARHLI